ncbi:MAG: BrnT family toxin [Saprospiraceae bacterium]|nr:BrnT family toxin [Saprospiraceae bacterium]
MLPYEWDESKNKSNQQKHFLSFEKAKEVFEDKNAVEFLGYSDTELRIIRIGKTFGKILISVVYTLRSATIRIISARQANKGEIKSYLATVYQINMKMKVTVEQAVQKAKNQESLEGLVIENLGDTQLRAADALALAERGILVPEQNIYYSDDHIAYDPDFDEMEWNKEPLKITWEEKIKLAEALSKSKAKEEEISLNVKITDREVRLWMHTHKDKMGQILANFIVDIYKAEQIMKE